MKDVINLEIIQKAINSFPIENKEEKFIYINEDDYNELAKSSGCEFDDLNGYKICRSRYIERGKFYVSPKLNDEDRSQSANNQK